MKTRVLSYRLECVNVDGDCHWNRKAVWIDISISVYVVDKFMCSAVENRKALEHKEHELIQYVTLL